ncbi:MAG: BspA family leucine-rich repeat surface protein [Lentilactobacillus hilgardii]|uniref:BspA family leucine-rich repeat surface protein n=1 Tax=Lentilactobacillus hilgardii TaxID=1588 RepID=UPI0039E89B7F
MNKNYQNYLYIFVSALTIGVCNFLCSPNVIADVDDTIAQVANANSQTNNMANVEKVEFETPNVQADSNNQVQQVGSNNQSPGVVNSLTTESKESGQVGGGDVSYSIENGTLTLSGGTLKPGSYYPWISNDAVTDVRITGALKVVGSAAELLFYNMGKLKSITGLDKIDTSQTTSMRSMFDLDSSLTNLDLSNFDTSNVTDMRRMFEDDHSLTSLDVSHFDTSKVTNMWYMFVNDYNLTNLDVSHFDTSKVTDMKGMFAGISRVTNLDVSHFDTSEVTDMSNMFGGDRSLTSLDVSKFDTSKVTDMSDMFFNTEELTQLDVSNFDTSKVTDMSDMFSYEYSLTNLDLSNFDTSNVTDMSGMFREDRSLTNLDLSNFDTAKVRNDEPGMFIVDIFMTDNKLWILKLGPKAFKDGFEKTNLPVHSLGSIIPDSNPVRYANGPGWQVINEKSGGAVDSPKGTVYDAYLVNRPAETETYVWQQESKQIVTVEYIDAATGKPISGVEAKTVSDYPGQKYDVSKAEFRPQISGYTWDGKIPTNAKGIYGDKVIVIQYVYHKNVTPSTPGTPTNPGNNNSQTVTSSTGPSSSSTSSSSTPTTTTPKPSTSVGSNIAVKGEAVYATKKIGLYKSTNFKKSQRIAWYPKQKRVNRPMFVVTGYKQTANGTLRYKVRDVNHDRKTDGKTGYITASRKYVVPVYYASVPKAKKITVISKKGVNAYKSANLTGKVKHYKKGCKRHP